VHYSVLPRDFLITPVYIPDTVSIMDVPGAVLTAGWDQPIPILATQEYGRTWIAAGSSAVLRVPSAVEPKEWNYVLNVLHADFHGIAFGPSVPFHFDRGSNSILFEVTDPGQSTLEHDRSRFPHPAPPDRHRPRQDTRTSPATAVNDRGACPCP
jgi:hypothetical protein